MGATQTELQKLFGTNKYGMFSVQNVNYLLTKIQYGLQMTQILKNFLNNAQDKERAIKNGTRIHALLQHIIIDKDCEFGDSTVIHCIKNNPEIQRFFTKDSKTEVPIAGNINNCFVSRRIDRLLINHQTKHIDFIDYKTDSDKNAFIDKYRYQLKEYAELLHSAYPDFKINGYILWLHDWTLDKVI